MRILAVAACVVLASSSAIAQPTWGDPARSVTPRDIPWFMAHPGIQQQTLKVCHSNSAYTALPDCANAEAAGAGLMRQEYERSSSGSRSSLNLSSPTYWSTNPIAREGVLTQCKRRAPGDEMAMPWCAPAAASKFNELKGR
jgi:hypothetical protein